MKTLEEGNIFENIYGIKPFKFEFFKKLFYPYP